MMDAMYWGIGITDVLGLDAQSILGRRNMSRFPTSMFYSS